MKQTVVVAIAALALAAAPAFAQAPKAGQGQTSMKSAGKSSTAKPVSAADKAFAREAAIGGMAQVEFGTLAKQNAASPDVKQFGERMVTDHSKASDQLKQWAASENVTLPTGLDAKHQAVKDRLSKLSGDAFDKAYMKDMVADHKEDVQLFRKESTSAHDPDLKAWAAKSLPTLEEHLKMADDTAPKVGVATGTSGKTKSKSGTTSKKGRSL